jgi:apolipoprotein N-acyltransferase
LIFIAWTPLFAVALQLKDQRRGALKFFGFNYLAVLLFNIITTWWIWNSTSGGALMAFICNSLLMAGALCLGFLIFRSLHAFLFLLGICLSWISFEFLHLNWELSWPWLTMGNYFSVRPLWVQWYEFTGVLGGSYWVLGLNLLVTAIMFKLTSQKALISAAVTLLLVPFIASIFLARQHQPMAKHQQRVLLMQPNIDPYTEKFNTDPAVQVESMLAMIRPYLHDALVIGPETALQEAFIERDYTQTKSSKLIADALAPSQCSMLIGASSFEVFVKKNSSASKLMENGLYYESYNTALFTDGKQHDFIHKSKLVLGVEKIPFSQWLPFLEEWSINNGGTSGSLGVEKAPKIFNNGNRAYAPIICYESIYGAFVAEQCRKGAQLLCIITNDGWWGNTPGHRQHNQFAALRAIETRKYVVRSGNTGISSVWNSKGQCVKRLGYNKKGILSAKVPLLTEKTFYVRYGDYLGWLSVLALLGLVGYLGLNNRRISNQQ